MQFRMSVGWKSICICMCYASIITQMLKHPYNCNKRFLQKILIKYAIKRKNGCHSKWLIQWKLLNLIE